MANLEKNFNENFKMTDATKLHYKSGKKTKSRVRNKPVKEIKRYVDDRRSSIITNERTEEHTKTYHEGEILKDGKWIKHQKHLKSIKKYK